MNKKIEIWLKPFHKTCGGFKTVPQLETTCLGYKTTQEAKKAFLAKYSFLTSSQVIAKYAKN